jgi:hypothetical protein
MIEKESFLYVLFQLQFPKLFCFIRIAGFEGLSYPMF